MWGTNDNGQLGQNSEIQFSSPVQIPGTSWSTGTDAIHMSRSSAAAIKTDGTLWTWGTNADGVLGQNQAVSVKISSPVQVPGTTWGQVKFVMANTMTAIKEL